MAQKVKKSFIMYVDMYAPTACLSLEQKGELWDAVFKFHAGEDVRVSDPMVQMAFSFFRQVFERDAEEYERRCEKNRENVRKRWEAKDTTVYDRIESNTTVCDGIRHGTKHTDNDNDNDNDSDNDNDIKRDTLSECLSPKVGDVPSLPEESESEGHAGKRPACPVKEIVAMYHDILPEHPRVEIINAQRRGAINARWADIGNRLKERGSEDSREIRLEYMRQVFLKASRSSFLTGRVTGHDGRTYMVTFDKLMSPSGFIGVIEGRYNDR